MLIAVDGGLTDADASVTGYQWQSSSDNGATWSNIAGATGSTYTPVAADQGNVLRVVETATDSGTGQAAPRPVRPPLRSPTARYRSARCLSPSLSDRDRIRSI